jgi:hypothetical protein
MAVLGAVVRLERHRDQDARDRVDELVAALVQDGGDLGFELRERRRDDLGHRPDDDYEPRSGAYAVTALRSRTSHRICRGTA